MGSTVRTIVSTMGFVCVVAAAGVMASPAGQSDTTRQADLDALLLRVKRSDPSVNFLQLRRLYAESDGFAPYRDDAEDAMIAAAGGGQYEKALRIARDILTRDYLNIEAHFASVISCKALGDTACAEHHLYVARGMVDSIFASGDGKTPATAFVVIRVPEEHALLRLLSVRMEAQSLTRSDDGRMYDVLTVRDVRSGQETQLYFNVVAALAATARVFGIK